MRRIRWEPRFVAAACGLLIMGAASARDTSTGPREADAIPDRWWALPFLDEPRIASATVRLRAARDQTIFRPHAEFLFAPAQPEPAPR
jgi:hypothetical protein